MPPIPMPSFVAPMLPTLVKEQFDSPDWIFEPKLDGYRAIAVFDASGRACLAVSKLKLRSTILDGEIVAVDENGTLRFQLLQGFQKQPSAPTLYYVFDVLWHNGDDLTGKTLFELKTALQQILKPAPGIGSGVLSKPKARPSSIS